jgi:UDP-glucose 4-epimerase
VGQKGGEYFGVYRWYSHTTMAKESAKTILITGGTGFIGSHICVELLAEGYAVILVDNLSNSKRGVLKRIERIASKSVIFYKVDIRDRRDMEKIFAAHTVHAVIHCAGLKAVGESVKEPILYYDNNVHGSLVLIQTMAKFKVKKVVFSSSTTVYGENEDVPYSEDAPLKPVNPYGKTKLIVEEMFRDVAKSDPTWRIALLRYFNPIGAHPSGLIGEEPNGVPNGLMPYITQVVQGLHPQVLVFGDDYNTPDGTGVRDYIHIVDLARGHLKALEWLGEHKGVLTVNLGTGIGTSVLDVIKAFGKASGRPVPYRIMPRRAGDVAISYANPSRGQQELGWRAVLTVDDACRDLWHWQQLSMHS